MITMSYFMGKMSVDLSRSGIALSMPQTSDMSANLPGLPPTAPGRSFFELLHHKDRAVGSEPDHAVRTVDAEGTKRFLEKSERGSVGALVDLRVFHWRDDVFIILERIPEGPVRIVHDVRKDLGVRIVSPYNPGYPGPLEIHGSVQKPYFLHSSSLRIPE